MQKNVRVYPGFMESEPLEEYSWAGSVHDFFLSLGADPDSKDVQAATCYVNGDECEDWKSTVISKHDTLEIRPNPKAAVAAWVYYAIAAVAVVAAVMMRPKIPNSRNSQNQGRQLQTAETTANVAKPNQVVPELLGRHVRYPDYLVQPRRFFQNERAQWLDLFLCVGPGRYAVEDVRIGNSPLTTLDGASYTIFEPGADVSVVEASQNWYAAPEVGGTSTGGAGLDLTIDTDETDNLEFSQLDFDGFEITSDADAPVRWDSGIEFNLSIYENYSSTISGQYSVFIGKFSAIRGVQINQEVSTDLLAGRTRVASIVDNMDGTLSMTFQYRKRVDGVTSWYPLKIANATRRLYFSHNSSFTITDISSNRRTFTVVAKDFPDWEGFEVLTLSQDDVKFEYINEQGLGGWAGPYFAAPRSENPDTFEVDIYFPSGLTRINDEGNRENKSVTLEVQYRRGISGLWTSDVFTYTARTLDQIGYTRRYTAPGEGPLQVRMRRRTLASTSTQVQDKVQWYGLRSLLRSPTSYDGWTTMAVRVQGLGQIAQSSENRVSVYATRILPTIGSSTATPTRDISAAVLHILRTSGYPEANIDMQALQDLHDLWTARGETADGVFDEGTVQQALDQVLLAGMAEHTIENGLWRPVREGVRTIADHEQVFSAGNTTSFSRTFSAARPDDSDGVEVEFQDEDDGFAVKKVVCKLPDSLGVKLERVKADMVTDRTTAWRIGMRRAREQRFRRWQYTWETEMDARNCSYKGYQVLIPEIASMGYSYIIKAVVNGVIYLDQPLEWSADNVFALRDKDGRMVGPFTAVRHAENAIASTVQCKAGDELFFGKNTKVAHHVLTTKIAVSGSKAKATGVNYDARIYADDDNTPPEE